MVFEEGNDENRFRLPSNRFRTCCQHRGYCPGRARGSIRLHNWRPLSRLVLRPLQHLRHTRVIAS